MASLCFGEEWPPQPNLPKQWRNGWIGCSRLEDDTSPLSGFCCPLWESLKAKQYSMGMGESFFCPWLKWWEFRHSFCILSRMRVVHRDSTYNISSQILAEEPLNGMLWEYPNAPSYKFFQVAAVWTVDVGHALLMTMYRGSDQEKLGLRSSFDSPFTTFVRYPSVNTDGKPSLHSAGTRLANLYMEGATIWSPGDVVPSYHGFSLSMIHALVQGSNIKIHHLSNVSEKRWQEVSVVPNRWPLGLQTSGFLLAFCLVLYGGSIRSPGITKPRKICHNRTHHWISNGEISPKCLNEIPGITFFLL